MRTLRKVIAGAIVVATTTAAAVGPALADPPTGVKPKATDIVGTGSDTIEFLLDQFSFDYNRTHTTAAHLYSWDALNPKTGAMGDPIVPKTGCASIPRPDGSSAGITTLATNAKTSDQKHFCEDLPARPAAGHHRTRRRARAASCSWRSARTRWPTRRTRPRTRRRT